MRVPCNTEITDVVVFDMKFPSVSSPAIDGILYYGFRNSDILYLLYLALVQFFSNARKITPVLCKTENAASRGNVVFDTIVRAKLRTIKIIETIRHTRLRAKGDVPQDRPRQGDSVLSRRLEVQA